VRIEAVLLDLDDTLLDERPGRAAGRRALLEVLAQARPELDLERAGAELDRQAHWFWSDDERHARGRLDLASARRTVVRATLAALGIADDALAEAASSRYLAVRDAELTWMEGAPEALAALRAAFPRLALVTNGAADAQRAKLERFALAASFDHVQIEGAAGFGKPEPRAFHHALRALGAPPERAIMIGNDFAFDVLGALAAGLEAIWLDVDGTGRPPAPAPRAFAALRSISEVPPHLDFGKGSRIEL
jgi:putative hydrolase of the HAD superfamily